MASLHSRVYAPQPREPVISSEDCSSSKASTKSRANFSHKSSKLTKFSHKPAFASSLTESFAITDQNNNPLVPTRTTKVTLQAATQEPLANAAVKFKYQSNAIDEDLRELRRLLAKERENQLNGTVNQDEFDFYSSDFERMMADDWLVTRFLLRGKKAWQRDQEGRQFKMIHTASDDDDSGSSSGSDGGSGREEEEEKSIRGDDCCLNKRAIYLYTLELIKICAKFRYDYRINGRTVESEFPGDWVKVNGMFEYEPDRAGNPTVYLRVALHRPKLLTTPGARHDFKRYMLYTVERCDRMLFNEPGKAICCIFDMTQVAFENIDLELTTWMIKSFKSCSPKLLCYVIIYNPPWFFTATFKLIFNTLLSNSKRQSIKFAHGTEILNYIDRENLPQYIRRTLSDKQRP